LAGHNLILVGGADSNEVLREVYDMTDAMRVTDEYPGAGKGVLEIMRNPWDHEKAMLLVAGSDEWGVKAGSEMIDELPKTAFLYTMLSTKSNSIQRINFESLQPKILREQVIININNYDVNSTTGLVVIPDVTQYISFNEPILPMLFVKKTLSYGSDTSSITWNEATSQCTIIDNDVPIAGIASSEVNIEGSFSYNGFYPAIPYTSSSSLTFGGGGVEVNTIINPVQYNSQTGKTKIWTRMVFDIQYNISDTGISVIDLSSDKQRYSLKDNVTLNITLSNYEVAKMVDLNVILREFNRNEYSADVGSMYTPGKSNVSGIYAINLRDILPSQTKEGVIEAELIAVDARNDEVLASGIITLQIEKLNQRGDEE